MTTRPDTASPPTPRRHEAAPARLQSRRTVLVPRLIARLYAAADRPLRAKLVACMVRPLSSLGLVAVAAGAFSRFLFVVDRGGSGISIDDAARFTSEQIVELARFVEQVSPQALQRVASLAAASPLSAAAFSASAAMLLVKALSDRRPEID